MTRIRASLIKLGGRLEEYMSVVWFTLGAILVPLGFYLLIEAEIIVTEAKIMVLGGFGCLMMGFITTLVDEKKKRIEANLNRQANNNLTSEIRNLISEMCNLISEIREDRNERNNPKE